MAPAWPVINEKKRYDDGHIMQMRLWSLPPGRQVPGSAHGFKYSLFYGRPGVRVLCYDNEAGKGDHVHRSGVQAPYTFRGVAALVQDFLKDVETLRGGRP